jgi:hypothetical protein
MGAEVNEDRAIMARRIGAQALAILMWLASAGIGLAVAMQTYEATRVLAAIIIPISPNDAFASKQLILLVPRIGLVFLVMGWLAGSTVLLPSYTKAAGEGRRLAISFVKTTVIELVAFGLASAIVYWLPSLVLAGTP